MTETIAERLKHLRTRRRLTRNDLATKAGINKQTIYRIEAGRHAAIRASTIEALARALGVAPEVLTGQAPLPDQESEPAHARPFNDEDYAINVPVDGAVRNAFSLVQMRYRVPIARIVELAPFLFVLAAEASLARRKSRLLEFHKKLREAGDLESNFPHLPSSLSPASYQFIGAEADSIATRDIWGDKVPDNISAGNFAIESDYDKSEHNPFVVYLRQAAPADAGVAAMRRFDRHSSEFNVCREDALMLTGGDAELAASIVDGEVVLHTMPRELLNHGAIDKRIAWLREQVAGTRRGGGLTG